MAAAASVASARPETAASDERVERLSEAIRAARRAEGAGRDTRLSILFHQAARLFVSRSVDVETGEIVRQFPPEDRLRRAAAFMERLEARGRSGVDVMV